MSYAWADVTEGQVADPAAINALGNQVEALSATPAWTALPLQNGWANFGSGFDTAGVTKLPSGLVLLRGTVKPGTLTNNTQVTMLPAGYRPVGIKLCATPGDIANLVQFSANPDGSLVFKTAGGIPSGFVYLNQIIFLAGS